VSRELVEKNFAVRRNADVVRVTFNRLVLLSKRHVEAPVRLVDGVPQSYRVVVARDGPPDDFVAEGEGAVENVAFDRMVLVVEPDNELLRHGGFVFFPCLSGHFGDKHSEEVKQRDSFVQVGEGIDGLRAGWRREMMVPVLAL